MKLRITDSAKREVSSGILLAGDIWTVRIVGELAEVRVLESQGTVEYHGYSDNGAELDGFHSHSRELHEGDTLRIELVLDSPSGVLRRHDLPWTLMLSRAHEAQAELSVEQLLEAVA